MLSQQQAPTTEGQVQESVLEVDRSVTPQASFSQQYSTDEAYDVTQEEQQAIMSYDRSITPGFPSTQLSNTPQFDGGGLFKACEEGDVALALQLVSYGADVNEIFFMPEYGAHLTALYVATLKGNEAIVDMLLNTGIVDVDAITDCDNTTALHSACTHNHLVIVKLLIEKGHADVNKESDILGTPLHCACESGNAQIAGYLLDHGADVNATHPDGSSPLWIACAGKGCAELVALLIEKGKVDVNIANASGWAPLHVATRSGSFDLVKTLVENGHADYNKCDFNGWTPLHLASNGGFDNIVRYLVDKGSDVNQPTSNGVTPLSLACKFGRIATVTLLVRAGADVNKADNVGVSPLLFACKIGNIEVVKFLLHSGADVDTTIHCTSTEINGMCPVIVACWNGNLPLLSLLVEQYNASIPSNLLEHLNEKEASGPFWDLSARTHNSQVDDLIRSRTRIVSTWESKLDSAEKPSNSKPAIVATPPPNSQEAIEVFVNGKKVLVPVTVNLVEACRLAGEYVPTMCYHPLLQAKGFSFPSPFIHCFRQVRTLLRCS